MKDVVIVILNWNNAPDTIECLDNILQESEYDGRCDLILVDNASSDDSLKILKDLYREKVRIVENKTNGGFAYGNNPAFLKILATNYKYLIMVNNDAQFKKGSLRNIIDFAEKNKRAGIIGGIILDYKDSKKIQAYGGGNVNHIGVARHFTHQVDDSALGYITGALMLIRREVIEDIGLLDEFFFMYWEDVDYCYRAKQAGWTLAVDAQCFLLHKESATSGKRSRRQIAMKNRSAAYFSVKHFGYAGRLYYIGMILRWMKARTFGFTR